MLNAPRIVTCICLVALTWESRRILRTWANPIAFYTGPFAFVMILQEVLIPGVPFGLRAGALIVGSGVVLSVAVRLGATQRLRHALGTEPTPYKTLITISDRQPLANRILPVLTVILSALYLVLVYRVRATGLGVHNGVFYRSEFDSSAGNTILLRALQAGVYASAFYLAWRVNTSRHRVWLIAPFLMLVFGTSVESSAKLTVILTLIIIGVTLATINAHALAQIRLKAVLLFAGATATIIAIFQVITAARSLGTANSTATLEYGVLGSSAALSQALEQHLPVTAGYGFGLSFSGLLSLFGASTRIVGVYSTTVTLNPEIPESQTNIYTWFVALDHDFTMVGTFVVIAIVGFTLGRLHARISFGTATTPGMCYVALGNITLAFASINVLTYYNTWFLLLAMSAPLSLLFERQSRTPARPAPRGNDDDPGVPTSHAAQKQPAPRASASVERRP